MYVAHTQRKLIFTILVVLIVGSTIEITGMKNNFYSFQT